MRNKVAYKKKYRFTREMICKVSRFKLALSMRVVLAELRQVNVWRVKYEKEIEQLHLAEIPEFCLDRSWNIVGDTLKKSSSWLTWFQRNVTVADQGNCETFSVMIPTELKTFNLMNRCKGILHSIFYFFLFILRVWKSKYVSSK